MYKKYCICIVTKDRWNFTKACLDSLYFCSQPKDSYDVVIVDNGSNSDNLTRLRQWAESGDLPLKNLLCIKSVPLPVAYNLAFMMCEDYEYRMKLDNDIVLHSTPMEVVKPVDKKAAKLKRNPIDDCVEPHKIIGAVASYTIGAHPKPKMKRRGRGAMSASSFLDMLEEFSVESNIGITALVPTEPTRPAALKYKECLNLQERGMSYLMGGCMMVNKATFDTLGYFDESIPRRIDVEYTQRALMSGFNIGYHPHYWTQHLGANVDTDSPPEKQKAIMQANSILNQPRNATRQTTRWSSAKDQILRAAADNLIVQLKS